MSGLEPIARTGPPLRGRVVASQRWSEVAFLHWRVPVERAADLLPAGLRPDVFDGSAWVGLIPFRLSRATLLGSPPIPYVGDFVEVNVRLPAVDAAGRRGVVFRSLEASRLVAVLAARAAFGLPYRWSRTRMGRRSDLVAFRARRILGRGGSHVVVRPGQRVEATELDDFLTARWGMFVQRAGRTVFVPNVHEPWPLHDAELVYLSDGLIAAAGLPGVADRPPDSVRFSPGVEARFAWRA